MSVFKKIIFSILFTCFILLSCNKGLSDEKFVSLYGKDNFDDFLNKSVLIRGGDRETFRISLSMDLKNAFYQAPIAVIVDRKTKTIISFETDLVADSLAKEVDLEKVQELINTFLDYEVNSIAVDTSMNVYIRIQQADKPTLIRFSSPEYINEKYKNWIKIRDGWYKKN